MSREVCLLNDSFYPTLDGVANAVRNYARVIRENGEPVCVVTPENPNAEDDRFDYPVFRYPGIDMRKKLGYTAGNPLDLQIQRTLRQRDIGLLHSHCPVMSNVLARALRPSLNVPFILTYHSKFDFEIYRYVRGELLQQGVIRALVESVSACDELWAVSDGAGRSIQELGYEGDYVVMRNGVDMPRRRATDEEIASVCAGFDLPAGVPVYLFVGRMMWYKGLRVILDALAALRSQNMDFRMVFIGGGKDLEEVDAYSEQLLLGSKCIFTGPIQDRNILAAWYSRADLFLFPSTYDTNGLVVREAAACSLGTVMIRNSCAAEGITEDRNGFFIDNNAASLAVCLTRLYDHPEAMKQVGVHASEEIYLSWDDAVKTALDRYEIVKENYAAGVYKKHRSLSDGLINIYDNFVDFTEDLDSLWKDMWKL